MAVGFVFPYQPKNSKGIPYPGAKLHTYEPGGTTPKATYSDVALTTAHTNPVVADGNGVFPLIYTADANYKVALTESNGTAIRTHDPILPITPVGDLYTHAYETANNPNRYGAVGNGAADESAALQSAIDAAVANSRTGVVDLMGRTYRIDSPVVIKTGLELRNGKIVASNADAAAFLTATGTLSAADAFVANGSAGAVSITLTSGTGIAAGSLLLLSEASGTAKQIVRVQSVSGAVVSLVGVLDEAFTTANNAQAQIITPVKDVTLRDLELVGNSTATAAGHMLHASYCENLVVDNVRLVDVKGTGVKLDSCFGVDVVRSKMRNTSTAQLGTPVSADGASEHVRVRDGDFELCTAVTFLKSRRNLVAGCTMSEVDFGIIIGDNSRYTLVEGGSITTTSAGRGISIGGDDFRVAGVTIRNASGGTAYGVYIDSNPDNTASRGTVSDCIIDAETAGIYIDCQATLTGTAAIESVVISNCVTSGGRGIQVYADEASGGSANIKNISINGHAHNGDGTDEFLRVTIGSGTGAATINRLSVADCVGDGTIYISGQTTAQVRLDTVAISNVTLNSAAASGVNALYIDNAHHVRLSGLTVDGTMDAADVVKLVDCDEIKVDGVMWAGSGAPVGYYDLLVQDFSYAAISGLMVSDVHVKAEGTFGDSVYVIGNSVIKSGLVATGTSGNLPVGAVSGSYINKTGGNAVHLVDYSDMVALSGNVLREQGAANNVIQVAGNSGTDGGNVMVSGNVIKGGSNSYSESNANVTNMDGNLLDNAVDGANPPTANTDSQAF